jgi:hypothetical protein
MANPFSTHNNPAFEALGDDARKAMSSAFDAMSKWRADMTQMTERNSDAVFKQMSAAAKSAGWPTEFVDITRQNMQNTSKMQMQMMDQIMGAWEQQLKNPGAAMAMPNAMMEQMKSFPGFGGASGGFPNMMSGFPGMGNFPGMPDMSNMGNMSPMVPLQFWMQAAEMWQKSWQQALATWMEAQQSMMGKGK